MADDAADDRSPSPRRSLRAVRERGPPAGRGEGAVRGIGDAPSPEAPGGGADDRVRAPGRRPDARRRRPPGPHRPWDESTRPHREPSGPEVEYTARGRAGRPAPDRRARHPAARADRSAQRPRARSATARSRAGEARWRSTRWPCARTTGPSAPSARATAAVTQHHASRTCRSSRTWPRATRPGAGDRPAGRRASRHPRRDRGRRPRPDPPHQPPRRLRAPSSSRSTS